MRLRLSVKFFIAFLATSCMLVAVMVFAMQYYARKNFADYIRTVEKIRLEELSRLLQAEYQAGNGWDRLRANPQRWHELLQPRSSAAYSEAPPAIPPGFESYLKQAQPPPLPREPRIEGRRERERGFPGGGVPQDRRTRVPPPDVQGPGRKPPRDDRDRNPERPVFGIEHRLALFDEHRKTLAGRAGSTEGHTLQEIDVRGKTVGWLGLRNEQSPSDPLDMAYLKQQSRAFYLVGAFALMLAAAVAFLLARHLLGPVRRLIAGTRDLAARKFETRISVVSSDELGQLAADFNQMAQTLQQYEHLRQQWVSDIAHELRTPLSILRGEIEALQDGLRQAGPERLASLHAEVVHMSKIVSGLHELTLAESAALHFKKESLDLIQILRACLQKFEGRFAERDIALTDALGGMGSITLSGDKDRLTQVFSNLLENTLRYTDSPGALTVTGQRIGSQVLLRFADTKPGVPTGSLGRLFERLYRVDASRSRAQGGSGLGLAICKAIVEAHGGSIQARHSAAGGLQIEVTLPLWKNNIPLERR